MPPLLSVYRLCSRPDEPASSRKTPDRCRLDNTTDFNIRLVNRCAYPFTSANRSTPPLPPASTPIRGTSNWKISSETTYAPLAIAKITSGCSDSRCDTSIVNSAPPSDPTAPPIPTTVETDVDGNISVGVVNSVADHP